VPALASVRRVGAALVWGGEAVAVRSDGRANPRQLAIGPDRRATLPDCARSSSRARQRDGEPHAIVGLQLTTRVGGRRPARRAQRRGFVRSAPVARREVGAADSDIVTDGWLDDLVGDYAAAARVARDAGFDFVDVKHCHGYLLHELLAARDRRAVRRRPGRRTRFLTESVAAIRRAAPGLGIGVRLSAFDVAPTSAAATVGVCPQPRGRTRTRFGGDGTGLGVDLGEVHALCDQLVALDVTLLCCNRGSPYWCRTSSGRLLPAVGRLPPAARPVLEVARAARRHRGHHAGAPGAHGGGERLSYLQEWMPAVAAAMVDRGTPRSSATAGRLSYPSSRSTSSAEWTRRAPPLPDVLGLHHRTAQRLVSVATRSTRSTRRARNASS